MLTAQALHDWAAKVRLAAFDVDGVLTDGTLFLGEDGREYKSFHARDGLGLVLLRRGGVRTALVSGRRSTVLEQRADSLGVDYCRLGTVKKRSCMQELLGELRLEAQQALFVGDDIVDLPAMQMGVLAVAVADAHPRVREQAHWVTALPGGRGAAREVCDLLLHAQGTMDEQVRALLAEAH